MEARKLRGAQIAKAGGIKQRDEHLWLVPSQSHGGNWLVDYDNEDGAPTCTCPDFAARWAMCKHIFAIEITERRITMPTDKPKQKKYTQNWSQYNKAQANERDHFVELLYGLCQGIVTPAQEGPGRPRTPMSDAVFAMVMKVYEGASGRRASSEIRRCHQDGLLSKPVSYNTIADYMKNEEMAPLLRTLVQESASPLACVERRFAVDSSGFGTKTYHRWVENKWGAKGRKKTKRTDFVKAHAACGVKTNIVTDLVISNAADVREFTALVNGTNQRFEIDEVSADKAYSSKANLEHVGSLGGLAYIPFKDGTGGKGGPEFWNKMYHYFAFQREEFDAHYHKRSNVETTFAMVKAKFGPSVRSRLPVAQANEVYCKFLCHNVVVLVHAMYELGITPVFWPDQDTDDVQGVG